MLSIKKKKKGGGDDLVDYNDYFILFKVQGEVKSTTFPGSS